MLVIEAMALGATERLPTGERMPTLRLGTSGTTDVACMARWLRKDG